jgi:hypothetical protein
MSSERRRKFRKLDPQAKEQILQGLLMTLAGRANTIARIPMVADYGIDGEFEFRGDDGWPSGKKIGLQLKSGNSHLRLRKRDGAEIFYITNQRHLDYWVSQLMDVYLVIRQVDERTGEERIRWMKLTRYLKNRKDKKSRQIVFDGETLDVPALLRLRDELLSTRHA